MVIRAATRGSALALWQTGHVSELIASSTGESVEPVIVSTAGDRDTTSPLSVIGGKGVFVKEVQAAVLDGRADIAVHSAKDLPADTPLGLVLAAVPGRADPRDALIGSKLADLKSGMRVGTGSNRRRVQLLEAVPGLEIVDLRGNIDTRLERAAELDAIVMAAAALDRLGRTPDVVERLEPEVMLPQVGQASLAIECRADDEATLAVLAAIDDADAHRRLNAERAFLQELGGDCDLPAGAFAELLDGGELYIRGLLANDDDASVVHRAERTGQDGQALGRAVAAELRDKVS